MNVLILSRGERGHGRSVEDVYADTAAGLAGAMAHASRLRDDCPDSIDFKWRSVESSYVARWTNGCDNVVIRRHGVQSGNEGILAEAVADLATDLTSDDDDGPTVSDRLAVGFATDLRLSPETVLQRQEERDYNVTLPILKRTRLPGGRAVNVVDGCSLVDCSTSGPHAKHDIIRLPRD